MNNESVSATRTILIAEDEALVLKMMTYRLQKEGYTVLAATDGEVAMTYLRTTRPDLVITDLTMPYYSGLDVLTYVKTAISTSIPVIVLSASGQESIVQEAFKLGADEYAVKPLMPNDLVKLVNKHLP